MVTQALPIPAAACALPEIPETAVFAASYVVAKPDEDITDELVARAAAVVAAAGLPAMQLTSSVSRYGDGRKAYQVTATDIDPHRNVFAFCSAHAMALSVEECLTRFADNLNIWARNEGLLNMEGSRACA